MATLKDVLPAQSDLLALAQAGRYADVVAALEVRTLVNNPVREAPAIAKPITRETILALIPPAEAWAIYSAAGTLKDDLFAAIDANNRQWLTYLLGVAQASGKLTAGTLAALQAELAATLPDPAWTVKVPGTTRWQKLGLSAAPSAADVQAAVHAGAV